MQPDVIHPTRFPELSYVNDAPGLWRIVDALNGLNASGYLSRIGPHYRTKGELLADLARYASVYGCGAVVPAMKDALEEIQSLAYSADNARGAVDSPEVALCVRRIFGIARAALEGA